MNALRLIVPALLGVIGVIAPPLSTQGESKPTPLQIKASMGAHHGDFEYLLGDWEFTASSLEYGEFRGYWTAVRLDQGQILDEYRVAGDRGEPYCETTTVRSYNAVLDPGEVVGMVAGNGLEDVGTAQRVGAERRMEQKFDLIGGKPSLWRIRYYNVGPDRFSWTGHRSTDGGRPWVKGYQHIEARRIGPPRSLGPLARGKKQEPQR